MSDLKTFPCPNCQQFINNTMTACKYCSASLEAYDVSGLVQEQERVNDAYNTANNARILAGSLVTFFFARFIPFLGLIALIGFIICLFALPFLLIYWQIRYGRIKTSDTAYHEAKKYWMTALAVWLVIFFVQGGFIFISVGRF
jgi:uncharacterized membrane protein